MAFVGPAIMPSIQNDRGGIVLTFVVSAGVGCDLKCPGCIVSQRQEAVGRIGYTAEDYSRFISSIAQRERVSLVSVQGYEPLLFEAVPLTRAIIDAGVRARSATALITNGTHLQQNVSWLADMSINLLTVSLDGADPESHDRARGVGGSFESALGGLQAAVMNAWLSDHVIVASILRPGRSEQLGGIPALLRSLGIVNWVVTPYFQIGRGDSIGRYLVKHGDIIRDLYWLDEIARSFSIKMMVDDEFDLVFRSYRDGNKPAGHLQVRRFPRPESVFRLSPDGSLSVGQEILQRVDRNSRRWLPNDDPYSLIVSARRQVNSSEVAAL